LLTLLQNQFSIINLLNTVLHLEHHRGLTCSSISVISSMQAFCATKMTMSTNLVHLLGIKY